MRAISMTNHQPTNNHHRQPATSQSGKFSITKHPRMKLFIGIMIASGLVWGLLFSFPLTYFFGPQTEILDVTFINPRQALIFWQSDSPTVGYLKTGTNRFWRPTKVMQINEQADVIHTVMLDQLPLDGIYVSPHTEDQSWWHRSPIQLIQYQEDTANIDSLESNPENLVDNTEDASNNLDTENNTQ